MKQYWGFRGRKLHMAIWGVAMWAIIIFGYNQAAAGGVLTINSFNEQFPRMDTIHTTGKQKQENSTIQGTVIALYTLTGTFGALACTFLGDVWGRRWTIFVSAFIQAIGSAILGSSFSLGQFIVGRIILGLGTGGIIATVSVWQSELSKPESRGSHVSAFGTFCGIGLLLALWLDFGTSYASSSFSWRFPLTFPIVLSAIVMSFIFTLPESPRWLVKKHRLDDARHIMGLIYDTDEKSDAVMEQIREIEVSLELAKSSSMRSLFSMGPQRTFHRVMLAGVAQMMLQMTGVNSVTYYASSIFETQLKFSPTIAKILAASSQFSILLGGIACSWTVDRFGRRKLMLTSASMMAICQACLTGTTSNPNNPAALKAAVFFIFFYYFVYVLGFLGIPFLYASEIAPVHLRAAVCGISTAVSWLFNFLVVEITPLAFTNIGYKYFIVYAVLNAAFVPIVYFFFPETMGRNLEEIDEIFAASKSIFDPVSVAHRLPKKHLTEFLAENAIEDPEKLAKHFEDLEDK